MNSCTATRLILEFTASYRKFYLYIESLEMAVGRRLGFAYERQLWRIRSFKLDASAAIYGPKA